MSTNTIDTALDFMPTEKKDQRPGSVMGAFRAFFSSLREGIEAAHQYERLIAQGTPHQKAIEIVFRNHFAEPR